MNKLFFTTVLIFFCYFSCAQKNTSKNNEDELLKYVYTIEYGMNKKMTAFKIKGYKGLITCLHGFAKQFLLEPNFDSFIVKTIISYDGVNKIYSFPKDPKKDELIRIIKVDVERRSGQERRQQDKRK